MNSKLKILLLALAGLLPLVARAQVNYVISGNIAYVANSPNAAGNIVIASTYNGYLVTSIGNYAFWDCFNLASIIIPDGVTNIGDYAFAGCPLTGVIIPDRVISLGDSAFAGCSSLTINPAKR